MAQIQADSDFSRAFARLYKQPSHDWLLVLSEFEIEFASHNFENSRTRVSHCEAGSVGPGCIHVAVANLQLVHWLSSQPTCLSRSR